MPHCNKKMISFFLTTKCNLCCRYCYNHAEREKLKEESLDINIAKAGIDWYFSHYPYRHIRFYGPGEPTQEFNLMKQISEYAKEKNTSCQDITIELQTNGIFTEDIRKWLSENASIIWLSFDGMRDLQDYYRPINPKYSHIYCGKSSGAIIEENTRWLIEHSKSLSRNLMIGARATITNANVNRQREMIDYFHSLGIHHIWSDPLFHSVTDTPVCLDNTRKAKILVNLEEYTSQFIEAYQYAKKKGIFYGSFFTANFDGESEYNCRCCTPLEAPHITTDGYISACDMVTFGSNPHHMDPLVVGKWDQESNSFLFDSIKISTLNNRKSTTIPHCINCPAKLHCGGYCIGETLNETGNICGQCKEKCKAIITLLDAIGSCSPFDYLHP